MRLPLAASGILVASLAAILAPAPAYASNGLESPDNGVQQVGRGSAWFARGDDPLAAFYNPAALVTQGSSIHLGAHLVMQKSCFTRIDPNGQPVQPSPGPQFSAPTEPTCTASGAFPNPQLAGVYRVSKDFAIGLAVVAPHGSGNATWPESVSYTTKFNATSTEPAPNRYLLVSSKSVLLYPTLSAGYAITKQLSIGAGFVWGMAPSVQFTNFAETTSPKPPRDDFNGHGDVKAQLSTKDLFIPGFILSALWQATERLDVAAWYKWSDAIRANADVHIRSNYWTPQGQVNPAPDSAANITDRQAAGTLKFNIPMEAKLGVRFHQPRQNPGPRPEWAGKRDSAKPVRDPMSEDLFDVELDFTWANDSAVQNIELRFQPGIAVAGTPGTLPQNADIPHNWRDVVGVRLGGEVVPLPSVLALRAGGFFESKGQDDKYLNLDFDLATRIGLSGGATVRIWRLDVSAAYAHTFYGTLDNGGQGVLHPLSGDKTTPDLRGLQVVNGGKLTTTLNEVALGATAHF